MALALDLIRSDRPGTPDASGENRSHAGLSGRRRPCEDRPACAQTAEIVRYENVGPTGYNMVQKGEIVVVWGANPREGASDRILAYEKQTPQSGGFVLMQDGMTVKELTSVEFQAAQKAGTAVSAGAAGKPK
jgi:hypothetical protein